MPSSPARWIRPVAALGLAWNTFGLVQFLTTTLASRASLIAGGMTPAQADLYLQLPAWMTAAFAVGVAGGAAGSVLLGLQRRAAEPVLAVSCAAYLALFGGDIVHGVFAAFGTPQVAVLTLVVAIALGLLAAARSAGRLAASPASFGAGAMRA